MRARTEVGDVALAGIKSPARPVKALMYDVSALAPEAAENASRRRLSYIADG